MSSAEVAPPILSAEELARIDKHCRVTGHIVSADRQRLLASHEALRRENGDLRTALDALVRGFNADKPNREDWNAPGHCHKVRERWDGWGETRHQKPCELCIAWNAARALLTAEPEKPTGRMLTPAEHDAYWKAHAEAWPEGGDDPEAAEPEKPRRYATYGLSESRPAEPEKCPTCRGLGTPSDDGYGRPCRTCGGLGVLQNPDNEVDAYYERENTPFEPLP